MKLFLASNSGLPLYSWCKKELADFIGKDPVTFISAATVYNTEEYFKLAKESLNYLGVEVYHLNLEKIELALIDRAKIFFVGGGNTYNLLRKLRENKLLGKIKEKVMSGTKYVGFSAGANIAGPTILTTNDWNVVGTTQFDGLNLVPFNINPHYIGPYDKSVFSGESRDDRINEYFVYNDNSVMAIEEKTMIIIEGDEIRIAGYGNVKLFKKDAEPKILKAGEKIRLSGL